MKEYSRLHHQSNEYPCDLAVAGLQNLYDQKYLNTSRKEEIKNASSMAKIGAWLLTIYNIGVSWIGGYVLSASLLSWLPAMLHPVFLIACILIGIFQAALSLGSNVSDAKTSLGVWLFPENKEIKDFKKRLDLTKSAYNDLSNELKKENFSREQLHTLLKIVKKNNDEIKSLYKKIQSKQKETFKYKIKKYSVLALSSTLHFGGGFILGKGLFGLIGLAFVPTPVTIAIGVLAGVLALTSFLALKRHIIVGNLNRVLHRPEHLSDNINSFINSKGGLSKLETSLRCAIYKEKILILYKNKISANDKLHFSTRHAGKEFHKSISDQSKLTHKKTRKIFYQAYANEHIFFLNSLHGANERDRKLGNTRSVRSNLNIYKC